MLLSPTLAVALAAASAVAAAALYVVGRPRVALVTLVVPVLLIEDDRQSGTPPNFPALWGPVPGFGSVRIADVLLALLVASVAWHLMDHGDRPRAVGALAIPLIIFGFALVAGVITGLSNPAAQTGALVAAARPVLFLVVLPLAAVNLPAGPDWWRRVCLVIAAIVAAKAVVGITALLLGGVHTPGRIAVTYYQPSMNFLCIIYLAVVLCCALSQVRLPRMVLLGAPFVFVSLMLSYRRSFWLAALLGLLVIIVCWSLKRSEFGRLRRVAVVGTAGVVAACLVLGTANGVIPLGPQDVIATRLGSFSTTSLRTSKFDRYRVTEQANIVRELGRNPLSGVGLGGPWTARRPLSVSFANQRLYSHVVVTSLWLKLGVLGAVAYVALVLTSVYMGLALWFRTTGISAAAGLALAASLCALALAETTASFTAVDPRFSVVLGVVLGVLWLLHSGEWRSGEASSATPLFLGHRL